MIPATYVAAPKMEKDSLDVLIRSLPRSPGAADYVHAANGAFRPLKHQWMLLPANFTEEKN